MEIKIKCNNCKCEIITNEKEVKTLIKKDIAIKKGSINVFRRTDENYVYCIKYKPIKNISSEKYINCPVCNNRIYMCYGNPVSKKIEIESDIFFMMGVEGLDKNIEKQLGVKVIDVNRKAKKTKKGHIYS